VRPQLYEAAGLAAVHEHQDDERQPARDAQSGPAPPLARVHGWRLPHQEGGDDGHDAPPPGRQGSDRQTDVRVDHQHAEHQQGGRPREDVPQRRGHAVPSEPSAERERDRHPDHEQERRQDEIGQGDRVGVLTGVAQEVGRALDRVGLVDEQHQQDDQAAQQVEREQALHGPRVR
jgi:hypothetical protein